MKMMGISLVHLKGFPESRVVRYEYRESPETIYKCGSYDNGCGYIGAGFEKIEDGLHCEDCGAHDAFKCPRCGELNDSIGIKKYHRLENGGLRNDDWYPDIVTKEEQLNDIPPNIRAFIEGNLPFSDAEKEQG